MKGFKISVIKELNKKTNKFEENIQILPENITVDEFIVLAGASLEYSLKAAYEQIKDKAKITTDKEDKDLRAALYDRMVLLTTEIALGIYPEYVDLYKKSPEAFMAELDKKVAELNDAKGNK